MVKLITVQRAKNEVKRLQEYIHLVETYEADTLEKWIIKEYAYTNSLIKVVNRASELGYNKNGDSIDRAYVTSVIRGKASDNLHKLIKSGYMKRIRKSKKIR